jgi:hypothetical protein
MNIDFNSAEMTSKTVEFLGQIEGRDFTVVANWNSWDDWSVDDIEWHDEAGTEEHEEQIKEFFLSKAN